MATVGDDYPPYANRLEALGLEQAHVRRVPGTFTAQAFITTDIGNNQLIAFHPGAMNFSHHNHISDASGVGLGIVAPDGRDGMLQHAREFHEAGISFIFDPGQGLPMFDGKELMSFIGLADYVTANDYEAKLLQERTGKTIEDLSRLVKALIVTQGEKGSLVFVQGKPEAIPAVKPAQILDPTGCGDAYRAGLLYGIAGNFDWPTTGRLASLLGSIKIAQRGAQNHHFSRDEISQRFREEFGRAPW
jgi:adenosine kinase